MANSHRSTTPSCGDARSRSVRMLGVPSALALLLVTTCCRSIVGLPSEPPPPTVGTKTATDIWPAWAPAGDWIVFHRRFPTTYGPPGLYRLSLVTGEPTLICAGSYIGPTAPRVSPDGRTVVAEWAGQVVLIDVATGATRQPMYTDNFASTPDWSPDGKQIVYSRLLRRYNEPFDSAGAHIFDIASGRDSATQVYGLNPRWSPDGRFISTKQGSPSSLLSIDVATGRVDTLFAAPDQIENPQWTHSQPDNQLGVAFTSRSGRTQFGLFALAESKTTREFDLVLGPTDALSPDGRSIIFLRAQHDSTAVLFYKRLDDPYGTSVRQLTHYQQ